ncbi:MAG: MGMT family protein [Candidatus Promineifilaceae bacterium]|nr:MGMT family protein [Candidatus Promineifilaceae bacterium]
MPYTSPPDQQDYYEQVWDLVRQVPPGKVVTYGQIAQLLLPPLGIDLQEYKAYGPRWVGGAMAACSDDVPWQRVINSQGKISARPGAERQRQLLEEEGIMFAKDKIDLKVYMWRGPGQEDEPRQARLF